MPARKRHLDERARLACEAEDGLEYEPRQDATDGELPRRHDAGHDDVRSRDSPDLLERRQAFSKEERRAHDVDEQSRQDSPDREHLVRKDTVAADDASHAFWT